MKPENLATLKSVEDWLEVSFSTNITAYQNRIKQLLDDFGDLYSSDLLNTHRDKAAPATGKAGTSSNKAGGESLEDGSVSTISSV